MLVLAWIRIFIQTNCNNLNIPMYLQQIITKYTKKYFENTTLLSFTEEIHLFQLLKKHLNENIKCFTLLHRASDYNFQNEHFHEVFDEIDINLSAGNVCIIKTEFGHILGGYTSCTWNGRGHSFLDKDAIIFLLRSKIKEIQSEVPWIFYLNKAYQAGMVLDDCGPIFGRGFDIFIKPRCNRRDDEDQIIYDMKANQSTLKSYSNAEYQKIKGIHPIGGGHDDYYNVIDYEVFNIELFKS